MEGSSYTIEQWLQGMVDYDLPSATLRAVLYNRGISEGTEMAELDTREGPRPLSRGHLPLARVVLLHLLGRV